MFFLPKGRASLTSIRSLLFFFLLLLEGQIWHTTILLCGKSFYSFSRTNSIISQVNGAVSR